MIKRARSPITAVCVAAGAAALLAACQGSTGGNGSGGGRTSPASSTSARTPSPTSSLPAPSAGSSAHSPAPHTSSSGAAGSSASGSSGAAAPGTGPTGGPVPRGFRPLSATFVSAAQGWVLGTAPCSSAPCTSVLRTRNGGGHWRGVPAPRATLTVSGDPARAQVRAIRFADPADGWVFGRQLWSTHDGGAHWHRLATPGGRPVADLEAGGGSVYLVSDPCTPGGRCATTTAVYAAAAGSDAFRKLATVPVAAGSGASPLPGLVVTGSTWWVAMPGATYRGAGRAAPRRLPAACPPGYPGVRLAAADATHVDALCLGSGGAGSIRAVLRGSTDGGLHWRTSGRATRLMSDVGPISDNGHGVLIVPESSGASAIARTTDDGVSFHRAQLSAPSGGIPWTDAGFTTPTQAVAVLQGRAVYLSTDAGAAWRQLDLAG